MNEELETQLSEVLTEHIPNIAHSLDRLELAHGIEADDPISGCLYRIADAITANASAGHDETGGTVSSLTEAVMGITAGLCRIASAIESLASAIENRP